MNNKTVVHINNKIYSTLMKNEIGLRKIIRNEETQTQKKVIQA